MATISERLAYILTFDTDQGVRSVRKFGDTADKELSRADAKLDKLGGNMQKFGAGAVAFAGIAGAGLLKLAGGASDLNESVNAVRVTFGEAADGILELGKNAAHAVGLSKTQFNGLAVQFSAFAKTIAGDGGDVVGTMQDLTGRAADFASVLNIDVPEAATIFQSALAGETEPIRKFGIDLSAAAVSAYAVSHGIADSAASMTEAQKVQARYALLMSATSDMAGDFANTSDQLANSQRVLKADLANLADNIGTGLLPMLGAVVGAASKVTDAFSSLSPEAQGTIGAVAGVGTALLALAGVTSFVAGKLITMRANLAALTAKFSYLGPAAAVAGVAMLGFALNAAKSAAESKAASEAIQDLNRAADDQLVLAYGAALTKGAIAGDGLEDSLTKITKTSPGVIQRMLDIEDASGGITAQFIAQGLSSDEAAKQVEALREALAKEKEALDNADASTRALNKSTDVQWSSLQRQTDEQRKASDAAAAAAVQLSRVGDAARDTAVDVDSLKSKFRSLKGELSEQDAYLDAEDGFDRVRDAAFAAYSAAASGADDAERKSRDYKRTVNDLKGSIIDYADEVGDIPVSAVTEVLAEIDHGSVNTAEEAFNELARARTMRVNVAYNLVTNARIPGSRGMPTSHTGSRFAAGETKHVVPGQVFTPDGPGRLASLEESGRMSGGAAPTVNVSVTLDGQELRGMVRTEIADHDASTVAGLRGGVR